MSLSSDQLRALDTLRTRLHQLNETLTNISRDLIARDPLPAWPNIESLQRSLSFTLGQLSDTMTQNAKTLKEAHPYPLGNFPGHTQGDTMMTLLRKKLDTRAEEWIEELTDDFHADGEGGLDRDELEGLWSWASSCSQGIVGPMLENEDFGDDFTLAEREEGVENVRTGLRRKLWDDDSGEEDEDKMKEDVMPEKKEVEEGVNPELKPLPLETVLRFVATGAMPTRPNR